MVAAYRLVDSASNVVSLNPDYDIKFEGKKIETSHRTRGGANYRYTWATYDRVKFKVEDLSSSDMRQINSWWAANTALLLYDVNSTVVCSGYLTNASKPIDQYMKPYVDQFKGTIEMEGY